MTFRERVCFSRAWAEKVWLLKGFASGFALVVVLCLIAGPTAAADDVSPAASDTESEAIAESEETESDETETEETQVEETKPLTRQERLRQEREAQIKAQTEIAQQKYNELVSSYLASKHDDREALMDELVPLQRFLEPEQRRMYSQLRRVWPEVRPEWWRSTDSDRPVSFTAEIWDQRFTANYMPTRELGLQAVFARLDASQTRIIGLDVIVTWRSSYIDNHRPALGGMSEKHDLTFDHFSEAIIWHELGHNYITNNLPLSAALKLYREHRNIFSHLQEYYADMTTIRHGSPKAQRTMMWFRLNEMDRYEASRPHTRAGYAIGAWFIQEAMMNPDDWPSVRFPPSVPDEQVELNTIMYVYENWEPEWTIEEHLQLRDLAEQYLRRNGKTIFRRHGELRMPAGGRLKLLAMEDRDYAREREAWVKKRLEELIKSGRADVLAEGESYDPPYRSRQRIQEIEDSNEEVLRIDVPM